MAKKLNIIGIPKNAINAFNNGEIKLEQMFKIDGFSEGDYIALFVGDGTYIKAIVENTNGQLTFSKSFYCPATKVETAIATEENINVDGFGIKGNGCYVYTENTPQFITGIGTDDYDNDLTITVDSGTGAPIASTWYKEIDINSLSLYGANTGDKIVISTTTGLGIKEYTYDGNQKKWMEATLAPDANGVLRPTVKVTTAKIPSGQGFLYKSKGTEDVIITIPKPQD